MTNRQSSIEVSATEPARLVPALLAAGHDVRVMARKPAKLDDVPWRQQVDVVEGDVTDGDKVRRALDGQEVLYYLVHSLLRSDFVDFDARAASIVAFSARRLVWLAMSVIIPTTVPIFSAA